MVPMPTAPASLKRVLLAGKFDGSNLESSYRRAFEGLGCQVSIFDFEKAVTRHCRFGRIGWLLNTYLTVEAWIRKANRDLVLQAVEFRSDLVVVIGQQPVRAGALTQIKAGSDVSLVFVWPDTLLNLQDNIVASLPIFDLVGTYSQSSSVLLGK